MIIADNGVGLPENLVLIKDSLGMELFKILTKQIDAELSINGKKGTSKTVKLRALALFK